MKKNKYQHKLGPDLSFAVWDATFPFFICADIMDPV